MKPTIIVISLLLIELISGYSVPECHEYFSSELKLLECICGDEKETSSKIDGVQGILPKNEDFVRRSKVEILKYRCNKPIKKVHINETLINTLENLSVIDVSHLNISYLHLNLSRNYEKIQTFIASNNQLSEIPVEIFSHMSNIYKIDFSSNQFTNFLPKYFNDTNDLIVMNFSHNKIHRLSYFNVFKGLEILDLSYNRIESIADDLLKKNMHFRILNLKGNPLKSFNYRIFAPIKMSIDVTLPSEEIETLDIGCDDSICHFEHLRDDENFEKIKIFVASGNKFVNFPKLLQTFGQSLEQMSLSKCFIGTFSESMLEKFINLKMLNLSDNEVELVFSKTFSKLQSLHLENNKCNKCTEKWNLLHNIIIIGVLICIFTLVIFGIVVLKRRIKTKRPFKENDDRVALFQVDESINEYQSVRISFKQNDENEYRNNHTHIATNAQTQIDHNEYVQMNTNSPPNVHRYDVLDFNKRPKLIRSTVL